MVEFLENTSIEDASITMISFVGLQRATSYLIATCKSLILGIIIKIKNLQLTIT